MTDCDTHDLSTRVEQAVLNWPGFVRKRMFGGLGWLLFGNMAFGVWKEWLIVRCGPEHEHALLNRSGAKAFDITGKAMKGWLMVAGRLCR